MIGKLRVPHQQFLAVGREKKYSRKARVTLSNHVGINYRGSPFICPRSFLHLLLFFKKIKNLPKLNKTARIFGDRPTKIEANRKLPSVTGLASRFYGFGLYTRATRLSKRVNSHYAGSVSVQSPLYFLLLEEDNYR